VTNTTFKHYRNSVTESTAHQNTTRITGVRELEDFAAVARAAG
jgi:hypothetical protein